jgi:hypothetical protein
VLVTGDGFQARERVRVILSAGTSRRQHLVETSLTGSFTVSFQKTWFGPCQTFGAMAIGASGDGARVKPLPSRACMPLRSP